LFTDNRIQKLTGFRGRQNGRLPLVDDEFRGANWHRWIRGKDLSGNKPVEEPSDRGEVLFDGGGRPLVGFDVGGYVNGLDCLQGEAALCRPVKELPNCPSVGLPGISVSDFGGKELDHAPSCIIHCLIEESRQCLAELGKEIRHNREL
jgi:hypothetical protein